MGLTTLPRKKPAVTNTPTQSLGIRMDFNGQRTRLDHGFDYYFGTWNVLTLYKAGALANLVRELRKYKIGLCALQEIRWKDTGNMTKDKYTLFWSGGARNFLGTGFAVHKSWLGAVLSFKPKNERLCSIRLKGTLFNITIICAHAPTEESTDEDKDLYYSQLEAAYDEAPAHDVKMILGDFNAKVGKEDVLWPTIGKESLHDECNDNGLRLVELATSKGMTVSSTKFPHKNIHKVTWCSPDGNTANQIDHALIDSRHGTDVMDVRTYRGADADSDHMLVRIKYRQRISRVNNQRGEKHRGYDAEKLTGDTVREYAEGVSERLQAETLAADASIEEEWSQIARAIKGAAHEIVGLKERARREIAWFDEDCENAIKARIEARNRNLQRSTRRSKEEYKEARKKVNKLCRRKKRLWQKSKIEHIELLAQRGDVRGMYAGIRREKNGFQARSNMCEDKNGNLLTDTSAILGRWAEHFAEVLNNSSGSGGGRADSDNGVHEPDVDVRDPTLHEVKSAVKKMKNHKAPGEDQIVAEFLKKGGDELHERLHKLIGRIWHEEEMPPQWEVGVICPIHKKGSKLDCSNFRGITLLNVAYKLLTRIIAERLEHYSERCIGDYQAGFRRNRSTTDHIFTIRNTLEKCNEYDIPVHQLYVDFRIAYDSITRAYLFETMRMLEIPNKLNRLVQMTLSNTQSVVKVQQEHSEKFTINRGLRQGDPMSCVLFNLVLERIMRKVSIPNRGTLRSYLRGTRNATTLFNAVVQYLAYADDVVLLGRTVRDVRKSFQELANEAALAGLQVNVSKTKYMVMERGGVQPGDLNIDGETFEAVSAFKYLGSHITDNNDNMYELKERLAAGNRSYFALQHLLKSKSLTRKSKKTIYRVVIRPAVTYGCETWVLTKRMEQLLNRWERKILRRIYGAVEDSGVWRQRTNSELYNLYGEPTLVAEVKKARVRWLGHVERMPEGRAPREVLHGRPAGRRRQGRPRMRWLDDVEDDLRALGVRGWRRRALDREDWRHVVAQTEALNGL